MRLRHIPGCEEFIQNSTCCLYGDELIKHKGKISKLYKNPDLPIHIEIGMGKGRFIRDMADKYRDINFLGIERYESVLMKAIQRKENFENENYKYENLLFACIDARNLLEYFDKGEIDRIYLNFSDPWPKKRHSIRRLTSKYFLKIYDIILSKSGQLEFKTDNTELFSFSLEEIESAGWEIKYKSFDFHSEPDSFSNIMTEYEEKFSQKGQKICKLIAVR